MPDKGRVLGIRIAGGLTGQETVAAAPFADSLKNAKSQITFNQTFGNYLIMADTQRAIFRNIVDIILDRIKEKTKIVVLPSACGSELYSFFF